MGAAVFSKKWIVYAVILVVVVLTVLSFVLPYVGGSHGGVVPGR